MGEEFSVFIPAVGYLRWTSAAPLGIGVVSYRRLRMFIGSLVCTSAGVGQTQEAWRYSEPQVSDPANTTVSYGVILNRQMTLMTGLGTTKVQ